jgi:hypothetical protein
MSDRDYYEILGLTPRADGPMVDAAYWHLVRKYQALAATNPRAHRMIDELNEAYGVLGNPRLRKQYDAFRDDVLIQSGMIQPVASKPKARKPKAEKAERPEKAEPRHKEQKAHKPRSLPSFSLPQIHIQNGRTYGLSGIIALLAFAAAWQGVSIVLVALALAGGLALALAPTVTKRIGELDLGMPELPTVTIPQVKAPRINLGEISAIRELGAGGKDDPGIDADTLRLSTAATISRWRQSVGLKVPASDEPAGDIDEIETEEDEPGESDTAPLDAVMNILRNGAQRTPTPTREP